MNLKNKKALVTGAEGFIGSHLAEELVRCGAEVTALVFYNFQGSEGNLSFLPREIRSELKVIYGDVQDYGFVANAIRGQEVVFHLAALIAIPYSYLARQANISTNILGTHNVLQACLEAGVEKIVHTSTSETYGSALYTPIDEKHPLQAQSPYSASKIGADKIAESYHCSFGLPVATIRPFNTYGPRQSARAVIPTIICQALAGKKEIKLGSLFPVRDLNFVKDTVEGFKLVAEADKSIGEVINVGSGRGITIGELADKILELTGSKAGIVCDEQRIRPDKSEVNQLLCDYTKAKKILGYEPKTSLEQGLEETIQFVKRHLNLYKLDEYTV